MAPAAAPSTARMRDSFFDLPVELRLKVYELLFCFPETIMLTLDGNGVFKHKRSKDPIIEGTQKVPVHAFLLNKRVYLEASPVLYRCNKFSLESAALLNERFNRTQTVCKLLEDLEIRCVEDNSVWGYTRITKYLGDCIPSLRKLNFAFEMDSFALVAASVEFSSAITPCTSMFPGPALQLCGHILTQEVDKPPPESAQDRIHRALKADPKSLAGVVPPDNRHPSSLMHSEFDLPGARLSLIQLTGKISPLLLGRIEQRTCPMHDCRWFKTHEDNNPEAPIANEVTIGRRTHLRWGTTDAPTPTPKEVNMLQFYPEMSERDQEILQDFLKSYNRIETSEKNGGEASDSARPTNRQRTRPHVEAESFTDTGRDGENANDDDTNANDDETTANDDYTASDASNAPVASPDENPRPLRTLTLADYSFDDHFADEDTHVTSAEINSAWNEQFGVYGSNFGVSSIGTQSSSNQTSGTQGISHQTGTAANEGADEASDVSMTD